jgi:hypothetical protein
MGRYRLAFSRQRGVPDQSEQGQPHPPQEGSDQADAEADGRASAKKSKVRARVEHVFAHQKDRMGLFIRGIGPERAQATIAMAADIAYNLGRWRWR